MSQAFVAAIFAAPHYEAMSEAPINALPRKSSTGASHAGREHRRCETRPATAKTGRGSAYLSEGRLLRGVAGLSFRTANLSPVLRELGRQQSLALTTELYDRGALTTNCWPLRFDDVTEVLA